VFLRFDSRPYRAHSLPLPVSFDLSLSLDLISISLSLSNHVPAQMPRELRDRDRHMRVVPLHPVRHDGLGVRSGCDEDEDEAKRGARRRALRAKPPYGWQVETSARAAGCVFEFSRRV
jgi:hypothetical protein